MSCWPGPQDKASEIQELTTPTAFSSLTVTTVQLTNMHHNSNLKQHNEESIRLHFQKCAKTPYIHLSDFYPRTFSQVVRRHPFPCPIYRVLMHFQPQTQHLTHNPELSLRTIWTEGRVPDRVRRVVDPHTKPQLFSLKAKQYKERPVGQKRKLSIYREHQSLHGDYHRYTEEEDSDRTVKPGEESRSPALDVEAFSK